MSLSAEMTFEDLLNDPLTLSLMKADRVDPAALRADLRAVSKRLAVRHEAASARAFSPDREFSSLLGDCVRAKRSADAPTHGRWSARGI
jgi:hypothetical protein